MILRRQLVAAFLVASLLPSGASAAARCTETGPCRAGSIGPGGGTVFYDAGRPQWWGRYLEAVPLRGAGGVAWASEPLTVLFSGPDAVREVVDHQGIGYGSLNTALIDSAAPGSAASRVAALRTGGKADWFLPSRDELAALYDHFALTGRPAMERAPYWSSSENSPGFAFYQLFQDGTQFTDENSVGRIGGRGITSNKDLSRMPRHRGSGFASLGFRLVAVRAFGVRDGDPPGVSAPASTGHVCAESGPCAVGDTGPGGGTVFYDAGQHLPWGRWLEMAPVETETAGLPWRPPAFDDRARPVHVDGAAGPARHSRVRSKAIGAGASNTRRIVRIVGPGDHAAWSAWTLEHGGKSDWFLPSVAELAEARRVLYSAVPSIGSLRRSFYWSSSEYDFENAWTVNMKDGQQFDRLKSTVPGPGVKPVRMRAVRAFG